MSKARPIPGLFDEDPRLELLSDVGDQFKRLNPDVYWEVFRPVPDEALQKEREDERAQPA